MKRTWRATCCWKKVHSKLKTEEKEPRELKIVFQTSLTWPKGTYQSKLYEHFYLILNHSQDMWLYTEGKTIVPFNIWRPTYGGKWMVGATSPSGACWSAVGEPFFIFYFAAQCSRWTYGFKDTPRPNKQATKRSVTGFSWYRWWRSVWSAWASIWVQSENYKFHLGFSSIILT